MERARNSSSIWQVVWAGDRAMAVAGSETLKITHSAQVCEVKSVQFTIGALNDECI